MATVATDPPSRAARCVDGRLPTKDMGDANGSLATAADGRLMALYLQARFRETGTAGKGRGGEGGVKGRPWEVSRWDRVAMLML